MRVGVAVTDIAVQERSKLDRDILPVRSYLYGCFQIDSVETFMILGSADKIPVFVVGIFYNWLTVIAISSK